jgi:citrate lyase subunit beta/citryl-CoA lyase
LASARKIVDAYDAAMQGGIGVIDVDGQLVDVPVANRARDLLAYAEAIGL